MKYSIDIFIVLQISSTCPVCVTYEVRSKFVITSLRPAFAKIYPSTRPDLAVETFFHARPGSPLLKGITDDDFITWFDKTELASLKTNANIDNICECGRICSRDYEFRKPSEEKEATAKPDLNKPELVSEKPNTDITTDKTTTNSTETSTEKHEVTDSIMTTDKPLTTQYIDSRTTATESIADTTKDLSNIKTTAETIKNSILVSNHTQRTNDPIIIPTATYMNKTDSFEISNNIIPILPKISGELIVQKSIQSKPIIKKEDIKKKPLIRRKGTLKATYGDRHEKFFLKIKEISVSTPAPENNENLEQNTNNKSDKKIKTLNETNITEIPISVSKSKNQSDYLQITHASHLDHSEVSTVAHMITAITKSNIKSMHYRTKKPIAMSQIKKPIIPLKQNETHNFNKTDSKANFNENKTKDKPIVPEKRVVKTLKSINKEIHKIPPTPISETSKSLSETLKSDIAPENKGGFEILDKNNLWELLKEGSDVDAEKIEDKLQGRISSIVKKSSNSSENDNRSL